MKTFKKTLCLVLAVVMAVGVLVLPATAAFKDADDIAKSYKDAMTTLERWQILRGKVGNMAAPKDTITRSEVAAIAYRIMTGDVNDERAANFADFANKSFTDKFYSWETGYIGYCSNEGLIAGRGNGKFDPSDNVTGYELLAIMLRCVGYGKNHEFEGKEWREHTLSKAEELGLLRGISADMSKALSREEVAQIVYNAAAEAPRVTYVNGGYQYTPDPFTPQTTAAFNNCSLVYAKEDAKDAIYGDRSIWGQPGGIKFNVYFTYPALKIPSPYSVADTNAGEYWTAMTECELADEDGMNVDKLTNVTTYTNGYMNVAKDTVDPLNRVSTLGAQGRHTMVYHEADGTYSIVYVDTFLARVVAQDDKVTDEGGHTISKAYTLLEVYTPDDPTGKVNAYVPYDTEKYVLGSYYTINLVVDGDYGKDSAPMKDGEDFVLIGEAKTVSGTVSAIINQTSTTADKPKSGIIVDGKEYLYNCTYCFTSVKNTNTDKLLDGAKKLTEQTIGMNVTLLVDAHDNILGVLNASSVTTNVGVVLAAEALRASTRSYYIEVKVLLPDGSTKTYNVVDGDGNPFDDVDAAETYLENSNVTDNTLVRFTSSIKQPGYWTIERANKIDVYAHDTDSKGEPYFEAGSATTFDDPTDSRMDLVNSNTVFFIEQWGLNNRSGREYVFLEKYSIVKDFRKINDMKANHDTGDKIMVEYFSTETINTETINYVLVHNSQDITANMIEPTQAYAFLTTTNRHENVYNEYFVYHAVIDGVAGQDLNVYYYNTEVINYNGLYTYGTATTNGWGSVDPAYRDPEDSTNTMLMKMEKKTYSIDSDVLTENNNDGNTYYFTIADGCKVFLINPTTGYVSNDKTTSILDIEKYYKNCAIWYQLDQYGYINLIYVEEADLGGSTPSTPAIPGISLSVADQSRYYALGIKTTVTSNSVTFEWSANELNKLLNNQLYKGIVANLMKDNAVKLSVSINGFEDNVTSIKNGSTSVDTSEIVDGKFVAYFTAATNIGDETNTFFTSILPKDGGYTQTYTFTTEENQVSTFTVTLKVTD